MGRLSFAARWTLIEPSGQSRFAAMARLSYSRQDGVDPAVLMAIYARDQLWGDYGRSNLGKALAAGLEGRRRAFVETEVLTT